MISNILSASVLILSLKLDVRVLKDGGNVKGEG